jgi:CubicO group peptidase (beta-lactamase class C family)
MTRAPAAARAAELLRDGTVRRLFPAAVAEVGTSGGVIWTDAFGTLTFDDDAPGTDLWTIFDLASLTKPIATTTVMLDHVRAGRLSLDDAVSRFFSEWTGEDRKAATIRQLLEHASGLSARLLDSPPADRRGFQHEICGMPLEYLPGTRSIYSDLGFILLGFCAEGLVATSLAEQSSGLLDPYIAHVSLHDPRAVLLASVAPHDRGRVAPTAPLTDDPRRGRRLVGEVHDSYAAALGGFAGHAGLFGTASGVGAFARGMLRAARREDAERSLLPPDLVRMAIEPGRVPGSSRGLGWDSMRPTSSCGTRLSVRSFGHVGFTGTSLWIDPERDRYFVLLTNRVCGGGTSDQMQQVRRAFHDVAADI